MFFSGWNSQTTLQIYSRIFFWNWFVWVPTGTPNGMGQTIAVRDLNFGSKEWARVFRPSRPGEKTNNSIDVLWSNFKNICHLKNIGSVGFGHDFYIGPVCTETQLSVQPWVRNLMIPWLWLVTPAFFARWLLLTNMMFVVRIMNMARLLMMLVHLMFANCVRIIAMRIRHFYNMW